MKNLTKSLLATLMLMGFAISVNAEGKNHFDCSRYSKEIDGKNDLFMEATSPKIRCVQYERKLTNNILGEWDSANIDFYKLPSNFEAYKSTAQRASEGGGLYNFIVDYGLDLGLLKIKSFFVDIGIVKSYHKVSYQVNSHHKCTTKFN